VRPKRRDRAGQKTLEAGQRTCDPITAANATVMFRCATIERVTEPIGRHIALHPRRRGLSQTAVAGLVGRSESWLSQVERGLGTVDSYTVLRDLARVLRVDGGTLTRSGEASEPGQSSRARAAQRVGAGRP
jgi:hypothetical protein